MNNDKQTLQQLKRAVMLQRLQQSQSVRKIEPGRAPICVADRSQPLALSYAQQRLWFLDQFDTAAGSAYHMPAAMRLKGRLDKAALARVLDHIVARHESLRTTFVNVDGAPVQRIAAAGAGMALEQRDLRHLPPREREIAVQRFSDEEAVRPFDLAAGPLIRCQLLHLAEDEHVLLLTQHHIVSDGWSIGVLVREISTLYAAFSAGQADPLPSLAIQYADYAAWQRGWLQGDVLQAQSAFWKEQLTGAPALLELPTDRPRPARQSYAGGSVQVRFDAALTAGLKALSQKHGATLFMTLLAGWAALLARLSGQDDVVVGTPVANRQRAEVEGLIGFFVNTLALRVKLEGDPSVAQLLAQVKAHTLGAYEHQDLPFEQVVEAVQPARSMRHSPLFQVMLSLDNAPGGTLQLPGLSIESVQPKQNTAQFDLTLSLAESDGRLSGSLRYASDLFDEASIVRLAGHLETLLRGMAADDSARVASLPVLSAAQRHELLYGFNGKSRDDAQGELPRQQLIHQQFEARALAQPDAIALVYENVSLTYAELNRRANRLAHHLRGIGVRADARVALCLERGIGMVIGILATLKAGGGYVPLDPDYPADRLSHMIEDSAPVALLTESALAALVDGLPLGDARVVLIDGADAVAIAGQADSNPDIAGLAPEHLAYIIYTSGSTGLPKGVMVEHRNVTRLFATTEQWYGFQPSDIWTLFHSFAFDFSVWELWGALLYGGRLVIVPYLVSRSPQDFYQLLCEQGVTVLNQTPSAFRQLIAAQAASDAVHQLRTVVFGGEALDLASLRPWYRDARNGSTQLVNMYGITETTVHVTYRPVSAADAELACASPIGVPIPDLQIYILDQHGEPAPIGVTGELHVGGAGVARGYLNRPELNVQRFVADRFSGKEGARLYKTGDLGRWLADGSIDYLGRNDFQVKIRGFRIELGEIETRLLACDGVAEALVVAREDAPGEKRLVAYLRASGAAPVAGELRAQLGAHLADYMIPSAFVTLDAFPLTSNGKLDRTALPAPDLQALARGRYVAAEGQVEQALCQAWSTVLKVEQVGVEDNYFDIGGDSIRSIAIVAAARAHGIELAIVDLFRHPTVRALAQALAVRDGAAALSQDMEILDAADRASLPERVQDAYPMTLLQMGMVFHNQYEQDAGLYHDVFSNHVTLPAWDEGVLRQVLAAMAEKHPVLRTSFDLSRYSEPLQLVWRDAEVPLIVADLRELNTAEQDQIVAGFIDAERKSAFDLASAPLLRIFVHLRGAKAIQYTFSFHHAILDGWSVASFQTELFNAYFAALEGKDIALPSLRVTPKMAALREKQALRSERQGAFWKHYLDGHVYSTLPPAEQAQDATSMDRNRAAKVSDAVCGKLQALAATLAVPMRTVLLSAHLRVVSMLAGKDDVTTGLVSNVRPEEQDGEKVLGLFLNTLPLRQKLERSSWKELIKATYANELSVLEHRDYPYVQLQVDNGRTPYYEIVFNFINFHVYDDLKASLQEGGYQQIFEATGLDLGVNINYNVRRGLHLELKPGKLGGIQTERILGYYLAVLESMAADPDAAYDTQHFLGDAEAHRLLVEFNGSSAAYPPGELIHQQFEAHAARTPGALALGYADQTLSYGQLNARANQLAHYLIGLGVQPDDRVAICMERGIDMMVALLGVWKAGGAYVPVDAAYPQDRIAYMLADSAPVALLTQAALADKFASSPRKIVLDGEDQPVIAAAAVANPDPVALGLCASHLAYVIYTSGSTGQPKGAMLSHAGVSNFSRAQIDRFGTDGDSRVLQFFSFSFDACVSEITMALCAGGSLFLASRQDLMVGEPLLRTMQRHAITHISMPTSVLAALPHDADFGVLQTLITGGEALPPTLADHWGARHRFFNAYGPTEATVISALYRYELAHGETMPIGKPLANTPVYLLDSHLRPVPQGVTGELHIGGVQVARGYLNREELTAERFVTDPFSERPGARLYKSGDLARWLPDGNIEFVGRNDHQVKIRGFRIELGEIEARLLACTGVREALVIARDGGTSSAEKRLIAYLTAHDGASLVASDLRVALAQQLADYMLPSAFVVLDALPLTPNGKIDRKALPAPQISRSDADYVAPRNAAETLLCGTWAEVLKLDKATVGIHDNFFEHGGNSLLVVKLHSLLSTHYPQRLAIADYFKYASPARLAAFLGASDSEVVTRLPDSVSRAEMRKGRMAAQRGNRVKRAV